MASTDARPIPRKNVAYRLTFPIMDASGDLVTGATGLDSEVSGDAGTFTDCTNEAIEIATSSGIYYLDLTASEMNYDCVAVLIKTSTPGAKTTPIILYPEEIGDVRADLVEVNGDTAGVAGFSRAIKGITIGTVGVGSTVTNVVTSSITPSAGVTDQFKGLILSFSSDTTTANLRGQKTDITASTATGELTVSPLTTAPASGDIFTIE